MVVNYQSSVFALMLIQNVTQRTVRKYGNQKLGLVWTKKGLGRDEKDTASFQFYVYHT